MVSRDDGNAQILTWLGDSHPHLNDPDTFTCGDTVLGVYGGNTTAGAMKNEDAALIVVDHDSNWELAMLLDAHFSAESAELVLNTVESEVPAIEQILDETPVSTTFKRLEDHLLRLFSSADFRSRAQTVQGEASCLICGRKDRFIWWLSIGDCLVYLFHPELAVMGQFALNQRSFYEWIGFRNTFDLPVPCFASGVREMRQGQNVVCMATDGLFDIAGDSAARDVWLYRTFQSRRFESPPDLQERTRSLMDAVHQAQGGDSATAIVWTCESTYRSVRPSR